MRPLLRRDLGRRPYGEVLELQRALVDQRRAADAPSAVTDTLLVCEHDEIATVGRRIGAKENLLDPSLPLVEVERGGDITWHGPGQLVMYPIVLLDEASGERDLHRYLRQLEQAMIDALVTFGVDAGRRDKWTGVWIGERKIASIGIAVRRWVTYHGLALNVCADVTRFAQMRPCGLDAGVMTSLDRELGREITVAEVADQLAPDVARALNRELRSA